MGGVSSYYVYALAVSGSDLYAGGNFTTAGDSNANYIATWNGSSWSALGSGMGGSYPYVRALAVSGSDLYAGGNFTTAGGKVSAFVAKAVLTAAPVAITTSSPLPIGTVSVAYNQTLTATGGTTPYTWSIFSGSLPSGLTLVGSTGVITGTPTSAGTASFTVRVTDNNQLSATKQFGLTINPLTAFQQWQLQYFGCITCPQAAETADPDGDNLTNLQEFNLGSSPINASSPNPSSWPTILGSWTGTVSFVALDVGYGNGPFTLHVGNQLGNLFRGFAVSGGASTNPVTGYLLASKYVKTAFDIAVSISGTNNFPGYVVTGLLRTNTQTIARWAISIPGCVTCELDDVSGTATLYRSSPLP
jgi:hypothetical protein